MQKQSVWGVVGLGALLILSAGISPAWGEINKLGGDERPVMEAVETASFGTEDWVPEIAYVGDERPVMEAVETASFGTEDWVPEIAPVGKKKSVLVARKKHRSVHRF
ncbi:MAG: hypothetical protein OEM42_06800 [Deltaproteobacteria bacterium]|nr:hypothetical protein [Deltaproteobacteria bacterium]